MRVDFRRVDDVRFFLVEEDFFAVDVLEAVLEDVLLPEVPLFFLAEAVVFVVFLAEYASKGAKQPSMKIQTSVQMAASLIPLPDLVW